MSPAFDLLHADLNVFAAITPARMREWVDIVHAFVGRLRRSDKPLLAAPWLVQATKAEALALGNAPGSCSDGGCQRPR